MATDIILASASEIRQRLLTNAAVPFRAIPARIDEDAIKAALSAEGAQPRDIADALADAKARRVAQKNPGALVIGSDQVLAIGDRLLSKPETPEEARAQLDILSGQKHQLLTAAVIYQDGRPVWRHVATVRLQMRSASAGYLDAYVARNWDSIRDSVGGYKLEEEGIRLFARVEGDYFAVLGLPMLELVGYLTLRGVLPG